MFKPYIYKIAVRYFFSKDKKTIVNRINGFAFFMIVSAACVLLLVLSGFAGLKDFGLTYTSSFDPELKIVPQKGSYFVISKDKLEMEKLNQNSVLFAEKTFPQIRMKIYNFVEFGKES